MDLTNALVFALVVGLRFLLPLLIPFFPLPAIILALLLDGVDQTIFQTFTTLPLDGYQSYDKALDIYYLTVAYISTYRNWTHHFAFKMSRFLYYYRLIGVVLFEMTQWRPLLLIFPNTFEYFFIWYEAVRLWWNPKRLTKRAVVIATAAIWIVIKLPQEYWIHIAQRDTTDTIKQLLGGTPESPWGPLIADNIFVILVVLVVLAAALFGAYRYLRRRLPQPEHGPAWRADAYTEPLTPEQIDKGRAVWREHIFDRDLVEKVVLMTLLTAIFASILPSVQATPFGIAVDVTVFVVLNTIVSHVLARQGTSLSSGFAHFLVVLLLNVALVLLGSIVGTRDTNWLNATFFILLLSLIVTLFDRFQPFYLARFARGPIFRRRHP